MFFKPTAPFRWSDIIFGGIGVCILVLTLSGFQLTINYTESIPAGLYFVQKQRAEKGEYTLITSRRVLQYAKKRHYIASGSLIGKRIIAAAGDRVCVTNIGVFLNGDRVPYSRPLTYDSEGRRMPKVRGCIRLSDRQVFVMGEEVKSFDSRYFGPITRYKYKLIPLITFN